MIDFDNKKVPHQYRNKYMRRANSGSTYNPASSNSVDASGKLDASVWAGNFEEKEDTDGTDYLFLKKPLVLAAGFTMYAGTSPTVPSIFDELPHDDTLAWIDGKLSVVGGSGGGGGTVDGIRLGNRGNTYNPGSDKIVELPVFYPDVDFPSQSIAVIGSDRVMEVGKYIDMHDGASDGDYSMRLEIDSGVFSLIQGSTANSRVLQLLSKSGDGAYASMYSGSNSAEFGYWNSYGAYMQFSSHANSPTIYLSDAQQPYFSINSGGDRYAILHRGNEFKQLFDYGYERIDLTRLDENKFYPCIIYSYPTEICLPTRISIFECLTNTSHPSWATHDKGFTFVFDVEFWGTGWGTVRNLKKLLNYQYGFGGGVCCGGVTLYYESSAFCIWLRGGGMYKYWRNTNNTFTVYENGWNGNNNNRAEVLTSYMNDVNIANSFEMNLNGPIMTKDTILAYRYATNTNGAAIIYDKPGSYYSGIGSHNIADTIWFGACERSGDWIDSLQQTWRFNGNVKANSFYVENSSTSNVGGVFLSPAGRLSLQSLNGGAPLRIGSLGGIISFSFQSNPDSYNIYFAPDNSLYLSGSVKPNSSSDIRLKANLSHPDYAQRLLDMGLVNDYEWNEIAKSRTIRTHDDKIHTSLIYQNTVGIMPQMCNMDSDGFGTINPIDFDFIMTMAGAIQINTLETRSIKTEVDLLKEELIAANEKIDELERRVCNGSV